MVNTMEVFTMNYEKIYNQLILKAKIRSKITDILLEKHHILPRSLGGTNSKDNIVSLTTREHFIAHLLLVKMNRNDVIAHKKMTYALWWMSKTRNGLNGCKVNSWAYAYAREKYIKLHPNKELERKKRFKENYEAGLYKYDNEKTSKGLKRFINQLTETELALRMKNSAGNCDHIKRGKAIRKGKSSTLELKTKDGNVVTFSTCDNVREITGYNMQKIIYYIKRHNGLLPNGSYVRYITRYSGNDSRIGKQTSKGKTVR